MAGFSIVLMMFVMIIAALFVFLVGVGGLAAFFIGIGLLIAYFVRKRRGDVPGKILKIASAIMIPVGFIASAGTLSLIWLIAQASASV